MSDYLKKLQEEILKNMYTSQLDEKIYMGTSEESEENIYETIKEFFTILFNRKRYDPVEGGLQASMVIASDSFGMKVCEKDGKATHQNSALNIVRHLNGEKEYYTLDICSRPYYTRPTSRQLLECVEIRVLDGEETLMLAIIGHGENVSKFQIDTVKKIINAANILKQNNAYKRVEVGLDICDKQVEFDDMNEEHLINLQTALDEIEEIVEKKGSTL